MAHKMNITYVGKLDTKNDASADTKTHIIINTCDKHSDKCHTHNLGGWGEIPFPPLLLTPKNFFWLLSSRKARKQIGVRVEERDVFISRTG